MSQDNLALTPDGLHAYNRWHLIIGLILLLLLFLLPVLFGIGPNSWRQCGAPAVTATAPATVVPAPAAELAKPAAAVPAAAPKAVVYFDTGKFDVNAKGMDELKALVAKAGGSAKLAISGFHDSQGDPAKNAELAKQRAMAVRDALKAAGVAEDRIELRKPEVTSAASGLGAEAEARRVEVSIVP